MRTIERGLNSKASSSTPNSVAATGVPNTALIPAAAPATRRLLRWAAVRWKSWPTIEPTAPPVRMIGPFGAERAAGPDADGARDRLQDGEAGLDLAAVDEDPLHRLGDAVAPDLLGAEPGHEPDDETAPDRDDHGDGAQGVGVGGDQMDAESLEVEQVGEEPDHVEQGQRDAGSEHPDHYRQRHEGENRRSRREVAERAFGAVARWPIGDRRDVSATPGPLTDAARSRLSRVISSLWRSHLGIRHPPRSDSVTFAAFACNVAECDGGRLWKGIVEI